MRLVRWIIILSSIAYWYSLFSMDEPLSFQHSKKRALPTEILQEEAWKELPLEQLHTYPSTAKSLRTLSEEDVYNTISYITSIGTQSEKLEDALAKVNKLLAEFPEINTIEHFKTISKTLTKQFLRPQTSWLYIAAKLNYPPTIQTFSLLATDKHSKQHEKYSAIEKSIELNDIPTLQAMLNNQNFKKLFAKTKRDSHDFILTNLARKNNMPILKLFLEAGANPDAQFMGRSLLQNAIPHLSMIGMLIEKGARAGINETFIELIKTPVKRDPLYIPVLSALIKVGASLNPSPDKPSPLISAAAVGDWVLFKWLILQGANPKNPLRQKGVLTSAEQIIKNPTVSIPNKSDFIDILEGKK